MCEAAGMRSSTSKSNVLVPDPEEPEADRGPAYGHELWLLEIRLHTKASQLRRPGHPITLTLPCPAPCWSHQDT